MIGLSSFSPRFILESFKNRARVVTLIDGFTRLMSRVHFPKTFAVQNDKIAYSKLMIKQQI